MWHQLNRIGASRPAERCSAWCSGSAHAHLVWLQVEAGWEVDLLPLGILGANPSLAVVGVERAFEARRPPEIPASHPYAFIVRCIHPVGVQEGPGEVPGSCPCAP